MPEHTFQLDYLCANPKAFSEVRAGNIIEAPSLLPAISSEPVRYRVVVREAESLTLTAHWCGVPIGSYKVQSGKGARVYRLYKNHSSEGIEV